MSTEYDRFKAEIRQAALNHFTCAELAQMSREKFDIQRREIYAKNTDSFRATLEVASLEVSMWSPEKKRQIEEYLANKPYKQDYNEL